MKYSSQITGMGKEAEVLLRELEMLIVFNDNAPPELAEISVLHSIEELKEDIKVGDTFILGAKKYEITAIGSEAMETFKNMGHATLKFSGADQVELPGEIILKGVKPEECDINIGEKIEIC